jgi:ketosteroid isomerase-like protein
MHKLKYMKKMSVLLFLLLISFFVFAQSADELAIKKLMADQATAWNRGSIDDFMKTYWNNDSLTFIGHGGITYGYNNTLNNYKTNYNDASKMGKLFFTLIKIKRLSSEYYFVTGKWFLKRSAGDIGGYYTLLFRKIKGQWLIITDHTS